MDFDRWFNRQGQTAKERGEEIHRELEGKLPDLPDGLWDDKDGRLWFRCRGCLRQVEFMEDPSEFSYEGQFCGGSPYCLP